ncbi:MAG: hypothetical protein ACLFQZ_10455 [Spirochaetaceae bacterium]
MRTFFRTATAPSPLRLAALVVGTAAALAVLGCQPTAGFGEYSGVNLIEARDFDATGDTGTALWQPDDTSGTYMTWEEVGSVAPPGNVSGPVYRLEVKNLLENGDFEDPTLPGFWSDDGAASVGPIDPGFTGSRTLDIDQPDSQVFLDLAAGLADGFEQGAQYAVFMKLQTSGSSFLLELNDGSVDLDEDNVRVIRVPPNNAVEFPGEDTSVSLNAIGNTLAPSDANAYDTLSFGGFKLETGAVGFIGEIDDLRIVRTDQTTYARLAVPYEETGRPQLIGGGVYTFSVWIRRDPTAGSANRFHARRVSLGVTDAESDSPDTAYLDVHDTSEIDAWTEISSEFQGPAFLKPADGDTVMLHLVIEPTASQGNGGLEEPSYYDAGSILVAGPSLTWRPQ